MVVSLYLVLPAEPLYKIVQYWLVMIPKIYSVEAVIDGGVVNEALLHTVGAVVVESITPVSSVIPLEIIFKLLFNIIGNFALGEEPLYNAAVILVAVDVSFGVVNRYPVMLLLVTLLREDEPTDVYPNVNPAAWITG